MNTIAKLTITRSGYLIELTELGKQLAPGEYELVPVQQEPAAWILRSGRARWVELEDPAAASALPKGTTAIPLYTHQATPKFTNPNKEEADAPTETRRD
jgi:hypothetical protein